MFTTESFRPSFNFEKSTEEVSQPSFAAFEKDIEVLLACIDDTLEAYAEHSLADVVELVLEQLDEKWSLALSTLIPEPNQFRRFLRGILSQQGTITVDFNNTTFSEEEIEQALNQINSHLVARSKGSILAKKNNGKWLVSFRGKVSPHTALFSSRKFNTFRTESKKNGKKTSRPVLI